MPRCENCDRAMGHTGGATGWIPGVTICKRAGCEDVAAKAKDAYRNDDRSIIAFGHNDHAIRVTEGVGKP